MAIGGSSHRSVVSDLDGFRGSSDGLSVVGGCAELSSVGACVGKVVSATVSSSLLAAASDSLYCVRSSLRRRLPS